MKIFSTDPSRIVKFCKQPKYIIRKFETTWDRALDIIFNLKKHKM